MGVVFINIVYTLSLIDANKKRDSGLNGLFQPHSCESLEKLGQSVSHDNLATLSPKLSSSENDTAKIQKN